MTLFQKMLLWPALLLPLACFSQKQIDWKTDIEYIRTLLPIRHPNLFFHMPDSVFYAELDHILQLSAASTDLETQFRLKSLIARMGDEHTRLYMPYLYKTARYLPFATYCFSEGYFVLEAFPGQETLLGNKITHINGFPIERVVDSLRRMITVSNPSVAKHYAPGLLRHADLLAFFGFVQGDSVLLTVQTPEGRIFNHTVPLGNFWDKEVNRFQPDTMPLPWVDRNVYFREQYLPEQGIYYVQYNHCNSREIMRKKWPKAPLDSIPSFKAFEKKVFKTIKEKRVNKLVFDMRFNTGGNSKQGAGFIRKLAASKEINQRGVLYVVIGRSTFSSAILNTIDFKQLTNATILGETSGGKPNHYGEVRSFILPSSQLTVYYSSKFFHRVPGNPAAIEPDHTFEVRFSDYKKGIDPVLQWVEAQ